MPVLGKMLDLSRCPYCSVKNPLLRNHTEFDTTNHGGGRPRTWKMYICESCGGVVTASAKHGEMTIREMYPSTIIVDETVPSPAKEYLEQAIETVSSPAASIMVSASAIDAMLKNKGYTQGSLYNRIDQAKDAHLITEEMALWAHEIRLDANEPRHADAEKPLPLQEDAKRNIDFALALCQFLFVLPTRVRHGREQASVS